MKSRLLTCVPIFVALLLMPMQARAQNEPLTLITPPARPVAVDPPSGGYTVTGRVLCADTQRPARFAQVTLIPATNTVSEYDRGRRANGRTDLDGHFTIDNVPAGDYYATAEMTGYINDQQAVQLALSQGGDALNTIAGVPRVQVTAGGASVQLSLQRGAVVAGAVQWDDGSPAAGVQVSVQSASSSTGGQSATSLQVGQGLGRQAPFPGFSGGQTDDRGRFRLSGLAPGSYVVRANLQSPMPVTAPGNGRFPRLMTLSVYAPNKLRKTEGAVITLGPGEEHGDINIVLALAGMHTVSGTVSSSAAAVRSGFVQLTDQTDSSLSRRGDINPDGSFNIPYVPPGNYNLRITASSQLPSFGRGSDSDNAVRFQPAQESLTVADGDVSGVAVTVTPATTASNNSQ